MDNFSVECIKILYDEYSGNYVYKLRNEESKTAHMSADYLKRGIKRNLIEVTNLTFDKDDNLIFKFFADKRNSFERSITNSKTVITRDLVQSIDCEKALRFEVYKDNDIYTCINKAKFLGIDAIEIADDNRYKIYALDKPNEILVISNKELIVPNKADYLFSESRFASIDLRNTDMTEIMSTYCMFQNSKAKNINLSTFDGHNLLDAQRMFLNSEAEFIDLSSFNINRIPKILILDGPCEEGIYYNCDAKVKLKDRVAQFNGLRN